MSIEMPKQSNAQKLEMLARSALNGGDNTLTDIVLPMLDAEKNRVRQIALSNAANTGGAMLTEKEISIRARCNVIKKFADPDILGSAQTKDEGKKEGLSWFLSFIGLGEKLTDKIINSHFASNFFNAAKEKFLGGSREDFSVILKRIGDEEEIVSFAARCKINGSDLINSLRTPPEDTAQRAAITPEQAAENEERFKMSVRNSVQQGAEQERRVASNSGTGGATSTDPTRPLTPPASLPANPSSAAQIP